MDPGYLKSGVNFYPDESKAISIDSILQENIKLRNEVSKLDFDCRSKSQKITKLQSDIDSAQTQYQEILSQVVELRAFAAECKSKIKQTQKEAERRIQEIEAKHQRELEIKSNNESNEQKQSLKELEENYQKEIENLKRKCREALQNSETKHNMQIQEIERKHQEEIKNIKNSLIQENSLNMQKLADQYQEEIEDIKNQARAKINQASNEARRNADEILARSKLQTTRAEQTYTEQLTGLKEMLQTVQQSVMERERENAQLSVNLGQMTEQSARMKSALAEIASSFGARDAIESLPAIVEKLKRNPPKKSNAQTQATNDLKRTWTQTENLRRDSFTQTLINHQNPSTPSPKSAKVETPSVHSRKPPPERPGSKSRSKGKKVEESPPSEAAKMHRFSFEKVESEVDTEFSLDRIISMHKKLRQEEETFGKGRPLQF